MKAADTQREPNDPGLPVDVHTKVCTTRAAIEAVRRAASSDDPEAEPEITPSDGLIVWATPARSEHD